MAELKQIKRVANVDMDGSKAVHHQLTSIPGVGKSFANMICNVLGIDKDRKAGDLTEQEIKRIEEFLANPTELGAPAYMLNRRKDPESGSDEHLFSSNLKFVKDNDVKNMRKIKSYKGVRHSSRLPVRGQKTKSNFRRNKGKLRK